MKEKMAKIDMWVLFRVVVVPVMFIGAIIKHPVSQWCVVGVVLTWAVLQIGQIICRRLPKIPVQRPEKIEREEEQKEAVPVDMSQTELFAIRQTNFRITEQIKRAYPAVAWFWVRRPAVTELESGGSWRIQLYNTEPYNFADVTLKPNGTMEITMLQAESLNDACGKKEPPVTAVDDATDLKPEDELDRTDAMTWYTEYGAELLSGMIDDYNAQGHKRLTIDEDGVVYLKLKSGDADVAVDKMEWFLPRMEWPAFCSLLKEDGITASEVGSGLELNW